MAAMRHDLAPLRGLDDLVLVPGGDGQGFGAEHVVLLADDPAAVVFRDLAAKRLGDDLVAEADADQRAISGDDVADQLFQRRDPRVILVGAVFRPGDEPAIGILRPVGKDVFDHRPALEGEAVTGQQPFEESGIFPERSLEFVRGQTRLQYSDFHEAPRCLWSQAMRSARGGQDVRQTVSRYITTRSAGVSSSM